RRPEVPFDFVERVDVSFGKEAWKGQAGRARLGFLRSRFRRLRANKAGRGSCPTALYGLLAGSSGLVGSALFHLPTPFIPGSSPDERSRFPPLGKQRHSLVG